MHFTSLIAAAVVAGTALADPSYSCDGQSPMCSTHPNLLRDCDIAVNSNLKRNDDLNYGSPSSSLPDTGVCQANGAGAGCGVFIRGPSECKFSGNQMWNDYQDIRDSGCGKCGYKTYDNGCEMVIDYVTGCGT